MQTEDTSPEHPCDCAAHRHGGAAHRHGGAAHRHDAAAPAPTMWAALLPVLACAMCPVCLSTYAKILSVAGVGVGLSEAHHRALLAVAVSISIGASAFRARRARRLWPVVVAVVGAALVIGGHLLGEIGWVEWTGMVVLLGGALAERLSLRRRASPVARPGDTLVAETSE